MPLERTPFGKLEKNYRKQQNNKKWNKKNGLRQEVMEEHTTFREELKG